MIRDYENEVFTRTKDIILGSFPDATVKGELEDRPSTFPFVSIVQIDNAPYQQTASFDELVNHMYPAFEIQVYTNGKSKKTKAKSIMSEALSFLCGDESVMGLGFQLMSEGPISNVEDANIHRRVARIQGVIGENKIIYWR